jgi:hypothetical protein
VTSQPKQDVFCRGEAALQQSLFEARGNSNKVKVKVMKLMSSWLKVD